jgi:hypothetical protein
MAPVASAAGSSRPDICIFLTSTLLTGEDEEYIVDIRLGTGAGRGLGMVVRSAVSPGWSAVEPKHPS